MNTITMCFVSFMDPSKLHTCNLTLAFFYGFPVCSSMVCRRVRIKFRWTKITQGPFRFFLLFLFSPHDQISKESHFFSWFCSLECLCFYMQNEVRCNLAAIVYHFIARINFLFITSISSYFYFIFSTTKF